MKECRNVGRGYGSGVEGGRKGVRGRKVSGNVVLGMSIYGRREVS